MPEHRFLAVLGIFKIDPITHQMGPQPLWVEPFVEETEHGKRIEHLFLPLIHQVLAVGIQHEAIALQHIHHLNQVIPCISEQRCIAEQAADQLLLIGQDRWTHGRR